MEKTIRLDVADPYRKTCGARILSAEPVAAADGAPAENGADGRRDPNTPALSLILDRTVFFPEGGGQPADRGCIEAAGMQLPVLHVSESEGIVRHRVGLPSTETRPHTGELAGAALTARLAGAEAVCLLDWDFRFSNMQRHCGEHILSAVFYEHFGGINRGFHMGADSMTIDIALEIGERAGELLADEDMDRAEWEANCMVWDDRPVVRADFPTRAEAETIPMRKALAIESDITLVGLGDLQYQAGTVACCGTHPARTGEVGLIRIYKRESYKGMTRITFDAGAMALERSRSDAALLRQLYRRYSAEPDTLENRLATLEEKRDALRQELYEFKQVYLPQLAEEIRSAWAGQAGSPPGSPPATRRDGRVLVREYEALKADDLLALGRRIPGECFPVKGLLALVEPAAHTVFLFSRGEPDCGRIVKDNAAVWRGKGGGRADNARALFPARQDLDCFLDYLVQAFR